jgi:sugar phosphate permease
VATFIFIFKQALDVKGGENISETSGVIAEFASSLLLGWLSARLGQTGRLPIAIQLVILVLITIVSIIII